jgi:hypothetical protein
VCYTKVDCLDFSFPLSLSLFAYSYSVEVALSLPVFFFLFSSSSSSIRKKEAKRRRVSRHPVGIPLFSSSPLSLFFLPDDAISGRQIDRRRRRR